MRLTWLDLVEPVGDDEAVVLACGTRDWRLTCYGRSPLQATIQAAPRAAPSLTAGAPSAVHAGALDLGGLLLYVVRGTTPCAGRPGPTCNGFRCSGSSLALTGPSLLPTAVSHRSRRRPRRRHP